MRDALFSFIFSHPYSSPYPPPLPTLDANANQPCVCSVAVMQERGDGFLLLRVCVRVCLLRVDNCRCAAGCGVRVYDCAMEKRLGASPLLQTKGHWSKRK